jgi:ABC-type glycerol-3-phosphate transport system substrate-binding protein
MQKKIWFSFSILMFVVILGYLYIINQQDFNLSKESEPKETIELWASTPTVIELAKQYDKENEQIQINTRQFNNQESLLEELYGAVSATTPPDLAEVGAHYGVYPLIEANVIKRLDGSISEDMLTDLLPGLASRFSNEEGLWAWPFGSSLPVIYYNETLLFNYGIDVSQHDLNTWDELWKVASLLVENNKTNNVPSWGFHSDLLTPWYLMTIARQANQYKDKPFHLDQITEEWFTLWNQLVHEYKLMPPLTHQLAITQFVNGQGGFLLSSTANMPLIEKLVGGKFDLKLLPIPKVNSIGSRGYIPGGSGLVIFKSSEVKERQAIRIIDYLGQSDQAIALSLRTNYIPAQMTILQSDDIQKHIRSTPMFSEIIEDGIQHERVLASPKDHLIWGKLLHIQEEIERKSDGNS